MNDERIRRHLARVYGPERADGLAADVQALIAAWKPRIPAGPAGWSGRDALLITYADSLTAPGEPPLRTLARVLRERLGDLISFVHLLPFYPYTSDDGFSVVDYRQVRPDLGTWGDVVALGRERRLVFDGVINHVSQHSAYVRGFLAGDPAYRDFCIGLPPDTDTRSVLRTRNLPLLHDYPAHDGVRHLWTTFSRDQVDLNFAEPRVLLEILDIMLFYAAMSAGMVRLDAIPYMWKRLGTSCAHLPETHELIKLIRAVYDAACPHVLLLTETNVPHHENVSYFGERGDEAQMIYNFSLAPLILWSLVSGDATVLTRWAAQVGFVSPRATYLNITATHDGIGMRPTEGILDEAARAALCRLAHEHHGDVTGKRNADGSVSPYELNLNYFDAVNHPDAAEPAERQVARFLVSQAIPLACIGMPGIYVHSLFGSRNDLDGVRRTGRARSINRAQLDAATLARELDAPGHLRQAVFAAYRRLLTIRAGEPCFHPDVPQEILDLGPGVFALVRRQADGRTLTALHEMAGSGCEVRLAVTPERDLLDPTWRPGRAVALAPYQVRWLAAP